MNNNYLQKFNTSQSHGIMFHHFHSKKHNKSQGSISALEFVKIIKFLGRENILSPEEYLFKLNSNKLNKKEICLTFDDSLKSQYDVALPILDDFNLKAFWFVLAICYATTVHYTKLPRQFRISASIWISHI